LAHVMSGFVHQTEELCGEERAQRHLESDRFEVRDELGDSESAAGTFGGNGRQREDSNGWARGAHCVLSSRARAIGLAAHATTRLAAAATTGRIQLKGPSGV